MNSHNRAKHLSCVTRKEFLKYLAKGGMIEMCSECIHVQPCPQVIPLELNQARSSKKALGSSSVFHFQQREGCLRFFTRVQGPSKPLGNCSEYEKNSSVIQ